jgi:polyhydroxybutyrate depolymerase
MANKTDKDEVVKVRVTADDRRRWQRAADRETEGSLSQFVRVTVNRALAASIVLVLVLLGCARERAGDLVPGDSTPVDAATGSRADAGSARADASPMPDASPNALPDTPRMYSATPPVYFPDATGLHQQAQVYKPADYDPTKAYPLIVFLHGLGSGAAYAGWWPIAAQEVVYVMPLGATQPGNADNHFWNASAACCDFYGVAVDDVAYVGGLIDEIVAVYHVDPSLVIVVGASNGGFMAERLACDRSDVVTEIVDLAGAVRDPFDDAACSPTQKVAALVDHSQADPAVHWNGGPLSDVGSGVRPIPPVTGAMSTTDRGNCGPAAASPEVDHDATVAGLDTFVSDQDCDRGHLTFWYELTSTHCFAPTAAWSSDAWAWIQANRRTP